MMRIACLFLLIVSSFAMADEWPQFLGPKRDGVWRETGIVEKFPEGGPKQLWSTKIGGGYSGVSVAQGKVFVPDYQPGDTQAKERTLCLDAKTGKELWKDEYPVTYKNVGYAAGPRCTPLVHGELVYTLGTMGDLRCLKVADGNVAWAKNYVKDFAAKVPIWGFASHPIIDGDKLICVTGGTKNNLVMALDKATGKTLWEVESTEADCGYAAAVIETFDSTRTLIVWHGAAVLGLNPDTGKRLWKQDFKTNFALTAPTPQKFGDNLFVTAFYEGPMMLTPKKDSVSVVWKGTGKSEKPEGTDKLHSIMPTPYLKDGHIYGVCSYGELRCLKADTGKRVWETRKPTVGTATEEGKPVRWGNLFLTPHEDRFFLFNEKGELILAKLSPKGYEEISRALLVKPTNKMAGRPVVWTSPAFADKKCFIRNDVEVVCVELGK